MNNDMIGVGVILIGMNATSIMITSQLTIYTFILIEKDDKIKKYLFHRIMEVDDEISE